MRCLLVAAAALALAVASAASAAAPATLRLLPRATLTVAGSGFPANASVRVVAAAAHANVVRVVRASRVGTFTVELAGARRSCQTGIVIVASAPGIRPVRLAQRPRVCPPPVSPAR